MDRRVFVFSPPSVLLDFHNGPDGRENTDQGRERQSNESPVTLRSHGATRLMLISEQKRPSN